MIKKFFLVSSVLLCYTVTPLFATEDVPLSLDYVRHIGDGAYSLYGSGIPSDAALVNVYVNDVKMDTTRIYVNKGSVDLRGFYPITGNFSLERLKLENGSGGITSYKSDKKSGAIKVRETSTLGFNGQVFRQNRTGYDIITLPFTNKIPQITSFSPSDVFSSRKIVVNGQEQPLVVYADDYKDGVYYITTDGITFIEKNLTEQVTIIGLRLDGLASNYISIKKEGIHLDSPSYIELEDTGISKNLKIFFSIPNNFTNLVGKEIWINGSRIDNTQASIGLGQFIIRYDLAKLPKDQDTITIVLKDTTTNRVSDKRVVDVSGFSRLTIDSIDTGKGDGPNFNFIIKGNTNALIGDIYKFKININGTDYTRDGIKEVLKNASGAIQKDSNGDDRYAMKNRIEFRKTGGGLEFDFFYSQLRDGENILYIKNDNTGRESNKVTFFKKSNSLINHNYLTGASVTETDKSETLSFERGKDIDTKVNTASMGTTDLRVSLGKIRLSNLKSNDYYGLDLTLESNLLVNPFSSLALDTLGLEAVKNGNTFSFVFHKQGYGRDFKTDNDLVGLINEVLNTGDKVSTLKIGDITLTKLMKNNDYATIASLKNPLSADLAYFYTSTPCFDGTKDFCSLQKEPDPLFTLVFAASGSGVSSTSTGQISTNDSSSPIKTVRKNISSLVLQDFGNRKFQSLQNTLVQKYELLRKKGSRYLPTFRKATNDLLRALRSFELRVDTAESIAQVKSSLTILNEVLKQAKKE